MGRPLRRAENISSNIDGTVSNKFHTGPIGASSGTGQQIVMKGFVTGGSALDTTEIVQKGTKKFRCTTATGTATLALTAVATVSLVAGQCGLVATDSAAGTYFVSRITQNWIEIGALGTGTQVAVGTRVQWIDDQTSAVAINTGTYAVGHPLQPGRFQIVTN
jgi:hypothetical protein|tara:strand:- start:45 stop:530 length:486 start_codon:yes stop_codon:yes gene_type:complete